MAYSVDLRERVVEAHRAREGSYSELAKRFAVGRATVSRWLRLHRETGAVRKRPYGGGRRPKVIGKELDTFRDLVEAKNDSTRAELARSLQKKTGIAASVATIGRTLRRLGWTRKKRRFTPRRGTPTAS